MTILFFLTQLMMLTVHCSPRSDWELWLCRRDSEPEESWGWILPPLPSYRHRVWGDRQGQAVCSLLCVMSWVLSSQIPRVTRVTSHSSLSWHITDTGLWVEPCMIEMSHCNKLFGFIMDSFLSSSQEWIRITNMQPMKDKHNNDSEHIVF